MPKTPVPSNRPRHGVVVRDNMQNNGLFIPSHALFALSGTISDISGSTTGSVSLKIDAYGLRLRRVEIFHSGAASLFDATLESSFPNTGSFFDPRDIVVEYPSINGSDDFSAGIDQVEDLFALTDLSGNLYLKIKPHGTGLNTFKYLAFFEGVHVYIE